MAGSQIVDMFVGGCDLGIYVCWVAMKLILKGEGEGEMFGSCARCLMILSRW